MERLAHILQRIESKKADYRQYDFTPMEGTALTTFFDLAQEFEDIGDFYRLCVAIPKGFFNLEARLYLIGLKFDALSLVSTTADPEQNLLSPPPPEVTPRDRPYYTDTGSLVLTIHGKKTFIDQLPFKTEGTVLGLLEVYPAGERSTHAELFFEKYANRIGFNIHNRFLSEKNIEHLRFIRSLVTDIEHNIIVPNMVFKLFLRQLKGKIAKNIEIEKILGQYASGQPCDGLCIKRLLEELTEVNRNLTAEYDNIERHYRNMSLFLETLFRRSHFDQGRLTLRTKRCTMKKEVVQPQLERFVHQFEQMGITIEDRFSGIPDEETISVVDVGLIAQVYANLFSNALKYAREITTESGERKKYMSYGHQVIGDFFGPGRDGIKYNVFTTGPHISPDERERIFDEGFRGKDASNRPGTGHGLAFIKNVIDMHGGVVGYEATPYGNNFYFVLPSSPEEGTPDAGR